MNKPLIIGITTVSLAVTQTTKAAAAQTTTSNFNQSMTLMMQDLRSGDTSAATNDYNQAYASMTKIMTNHMQNSSWVSSMTVRMNADKSQLSSMMSGSYAANGSYGSMMGTYGSLSVNSRSSMMNGTTTSSNGYGNMMNGSTNYSNLNGNGSSMMGGTTSSTAGEI